MKTEIRKLLLSKSILIALILICSIWWNSAVMSQVIDSMYITPANPTANDSVYVHIEGERNNQIKLTATTVQVFDYEVNIIFHYNVCSGWGMSLPFHDSVNIGCLLPNTYTIKCTMLYDTALHNPTCQPFISLLLADSSFIQVTVTFIENYENNNSITIYPNPATNFANIATIINSVYLNKIIVYNSIGKLIYHGNLSQYFTSEYQLCIENFTIGIYFIQITLSNNKIIYYKLLKQ